MKSRFCEEKSKSPLLFLKWFADKRNGSKPKREKSMTWTFRIPGTDAGKNDKFQQFLAGATSNLVAIGYDTADLDEIIVAANGFQADLIAAEDARVVYRNKVAEKDATRETSTEVIRTWAQRVKNNPLVTPEILASFGIEPATPVAGPVIPPTELAAKANADGTAVLTWSANGNPSPTTYILESSFNGETWTWCGSTTKRRFTDTNATPGVPRFYRIRAQRAGQTSAPGSWTAIYPVGEGESITLAA